MSSTFLRNCRSRMEFLFQNASQRSHCSAHQSFRQPNPTSTCATLAHRALTTANGWARFPGRQLQLTPWQSHRSQHQKGDTYPSKSNQKQVIDWVVQWYTEYRCIYNYTARNVAIVSWFLPQTVTNTPISPISLAARGHKLLPGLDVSSWWGKCPPQPRWTANIGGRT